MKSLPNILSFIRLLMVPLFAFVFFSENKDAQLWALFIFLLAGLTDLLDGYLARKYNWITPLGTALDPLADKLMLMTALICLTLIDIVPLWALIAVYAKECFMILGGVILYFRHEKLVVPANLYGKLATALFTLSILGLMLYPGTQIAYGLLVLAILAKFTALGSYLTHYWKHVKKQNTQNS